MSNANFNEYFKGFVTFVPEGKMASIFAKHSFILENDAVIRISARKYFRMDSMQEIMNGNRYFPLIAPLDSIELVEGEIPESNVFSMTHSEYKAHKNTYR